MRRLAGAALVVFVALSSATACRRPSDPEPGPPASDAGGEEPEAGSQEGPRYVPAEEIAPPEVPEGFTVEMGVPDVAGDLADDVVRDTLRPLLEDIRTCYGERLARSPGIRGSIRAVVTVGDDGDATDVAIASDDAGDARLTGCVEETLGSASFAPVPGGAEVKVTLRFEPPRGG